MKKTFLVIILAALIALTALSACEGGKKAEVSDRLEGVSFDPDNEYELSSASKAEASASVDPSSGSSEESKTEKPVTEKPKEKQGDIEIVYASYSERPYAAVVGKCAEGATVIAQSDSETVKAESWHGWFSIRINCPKANTFYTFTQEVDGAVTGEATVKAISPITPGADMWPIVTGYGSRLFFNKMLPDHQHTNLPSQTELNTFKTRVQSRLTQLKNIKPNAEIVYMVVPSSMTVYPELVPEKYKQGTGDSKMDVILKTAKEAGATVIDLRDVFAEKKNGEKPLYYNFDSHWTDYGAFVGYTELFNHIAEKFPAAAPRTEDEFKWIGDSYESGDMIYYLQMSREVVKDYGYLRVMDFDDASGAKTVNRYVSSRRLNYSDAVTYENHFYTGDNKKPDLLVLRDSYSTQIYDILAERGNRTHYLGMWNYTWNYSTIASEQPDYIIYLIAEWNLDSILYK